MSAQAWTGGARLLPGCGLFQGRVGDNALHAHGAHQIVIGRQDQVQVGLARGALLGRGIAIPASLPHRLFPAEVLLVYFDPLTVEGRALFTGAPGGARILSPALCERLLGASGSGEALRRLLRTELGLPLPPPPDPRLATVAAALEASVAQCCDIDRAALAALVHLSPSRFSHWFVDQAGLPLRSYRKWLRLVLALHHVAQSSNLTAAAHAAGFADSAHLSRTFRQMFGMNPQALLQRVALHGAP
jgi:AraC-like DNA-binding protein